MWEYAGLSGRCTDENASDLITGVGNFLLRFCARAVFPNFLPPGLNFWRLGALGPGNVEARRGSFGCPANLFTAGNWCNRCDATGTRCERATRQSHLIGTRSGQVRRCSNLRQSFFFLTCIPSFGSSSPICILTIGWPPVLPRTTHQRPPPPRRNTLLSALVWQSAPSILRSLPCGIRLNQPPASFLQPNVTAFLGDIDA